jgi:hypothetical protein
MSDFSGFAGLDEDYTDIISRWVQELRREFDLLDKWWVNLEVRLNSGGSKVARLHWPAGPVSHPRIIAIYRKYYFDITRLNTKRGEMLKQLQPSKWGKDTEEMELSGPISENLILLEMMRDYAPDLFNYFRYFVYLPIGEDKDANLC